MPENLSFPYLLMLGALSVLFVVIGTAAWWPLLKISWLYWFG
jgi:hypothetical protein